MSLVVCKLPKAGLGNQLFPLMRAFVFASLNQQKIIITGYHHIKIGPYLRGEKLKRKYGGSFLFQKSLTGEWLDKRKIKKAEWFIIMRDPALMILSKDELMETLFLYSAIPHYENFFSGLRDHRELVKRLLFEQLTPHIKKQLDATHSPVIGIHIRMGDFRKLQPGEDFSKVGSVRTPETYFIDVIKKIRSVHQSKLPVMVFSDGYKHEFEQLFQLENIEMAEGNPDIVDLLLLSRSKIIVTAAGSTFSYWSGFLSDAPIILHPDHIHARIRKPEENKSLYEGPMDVNNQELREAIQSIPSHSNLVKQ